MIGSAALRNVDASQVSEVNFARDRSGRVLDLRRKVSRARFEGSDVVSPGCQYQISCSWRYSIFEVAKSPQSFVLSIMANS